MAGETYSLGVISKARRRLYIEELKSTLAYCLTHDVVNPFRKFLRTWIARGAPVDPAALYAPRPSLRIVIRQVAAAFPSLGAYHADARLWLTESACRAWRPNEGLRVTPKTQNKAKFEKGFAPQFIPWNLTLFQNRGDPYFEFNKVGFTATLVDESEATEDTKRAAVNRVSF